LASVASIAPASRSEARIGAGAAGSAAASASASSRRQRPASNDGHRSKAKRRCRPGASRRAMSAASTAIVPEPHSGSTSGPLPS
jgi:hypothetical protein